MDLLPASYDRLANFSARLMGMEEVSRAEIAEALGEACIPAFEFGRAALAGRTRRTTGEPSFVHSVDVALRARLLGYGSEVVQVCLLHDVIEDTSRTTADMVRHLRDLHLRFDENIVRNVRVLTNRYEVIIGEALRPAARGEVAPIPFDASGTRRTQQLVRAYADGLPPQLRDELSYELKQVVEYLPTFVDLSRGQPKHKLDSSYDAASELKLQGYRLYLEEINDDAVRRRPGHFHELALVAKGLDLVDNMRTAEVVNWRVLEKILLKAEQYLDASFYLHDVIARGGFAEVSFVPLYDYVKNNLVQQFAERRRALEALADSRFRFLAGFMVTTLGRLAEKYRVPENPAAEIERLTGVLRALNAPVRPA